MIYLRDKNITTSIDNANIDFNDAVWMKVATLTSYGYVGVSRLSHTHLARYIAVRREGLINLKEVEVYQQSSE